MKEAIAEQNPEALTLGLRGDTTYDAALIGYVQKPCEGIVACYDYDKCCQCLVDANPGWTWDDAIEWMEHNVVCAYLGPNSPVFFHNPIL